MNLSGSTAIVTGAAHRVGRAIAISLANEGCNIIVHYGSSKEKALETVSDLKELGVEASAYSADLQSKISIESFMTEINQNYSYHLLVNSAASFVKSSLLDTTTEEWNMSLDVNLRAPFLLIQHAHAQLSSHKDSLIVNIADLSGVYPWQNFAAHGISKSGLIHLTKTAARELAPLVRVNAIVPGPILPPSTMSEVSPGWQEMINNIPLKRSGEPDHIGQTVVYMANNNYLTGAVINVDGGEGLVGPANH